MHQVQWEISAIRTCSSQSVSQSRRRRLQAVVLRAQVHGTMRQASNVNTARQQDPRGLEQLRRFQLHYADLTDGDSLVRVVSLVRPDELYNLGAMQIVKLSFDMPKFTTDVDGLGTQLQVCMLASAAHGEHLHAARRSSGTLRLLEAIRTAKLERVTRFFQAGTSYLYGRPTQMPQTEETPFQPRSPYAVAKLFACATVVNFREAFGLYAVNGILYNHESSRRGTSSIQALPQLAPRSVPPRLVSMSVGACRRALRDAEDQSHGREDQPRAAAGARARQPGRQVRLGPRAGVPASPPRGAPQPLPPSSYFPLLSAFLCASPENVRRLLKRVLANRFVHCTHWAFTNYLCSGLPLIPVSPLILFYLY